MKEKNTQIRFYDSLLFHVGLIVLAALSLAVIVGVQHTYYLAVKEEGRNVVASAEEVSKLMTSQCPPDTMEWMLDYWLEHGGEMHILSIAEQSDIKTLDEYSSSHEEAIKIFRERWTILTPEDLEKMDQDEVRKLAEVWYNNWNAILSIFREENNLASIGACCLEEGTAKAVFLNTPDESEPTVPGQEIPFHLDLHPVVQKVLETGSPQDDAEHIVSTVDGAEYLYAVYPVILNGRMRCLAQGTFFWGDVKDRLLKEMWQIGGRTFFYMLFAVALLLILLHIHVLKPMKLLQTQVREYTGEKDSSRVIKALARVNKRKDEIGVLSCDISSLTKEIDAYLIDITDYAERKAAVDAELSLATNIQANALPKSFPAFPDRKEFELHAFMHPALEVGGDFYDFFMVDDDHLALVIADVSDKGVPSALFMMLAQTMIETLSISGGAGMHPNELFKTVNDRLKAKNSISMFVTVWMGILTISTGEMHCANAGHEYPALFRAKDGGFSLHKVTHSPPLGAFPGVPFREEDLKLEKGDILFVYTDGVTEATSMEDELFGEERMLEALNLNTDKAPSEIIEGMQKALQDFMGDREQFDDITMLCIKYNGN